MKIEYYAYYAVTKKEGKFYPKGDRKYTSIVDIRKKLPAHIAEELIKHPRLPDHMSICVESKKTNVVAYLDRVLKVKRNKFDRTRYVAITEEEIEDYEYFFIGLRDLDWGRHINYEFTGPTCGMESCPWGARITSPTRINSKSIRSLDLAQIYGIWELGVRFVISERLKDEFESHQVAGLRYEPCLVEHSRKREAEPQIFEGGFYVATVASSLAQRADRIYLHDYCKKHLIIFRFDGLCNRVTRRNDISEDDFQTINRVKVKGKEYLYRKPEFFVSRKVLNILLANKVADLRPRGLYFNKSFVPVPFD